MYDDYFHVFNKDLLNDIMSESLVIFDSLKVNNLNYSNKSILLTVDKYKVFGHGAFVCQAGTVHYSLLCLRKFK